MTAKILVVDDLVTNVKLLEAKLNSEYYDVVTSKSGVEALEIVKTDTSFDVILLDVMMPELDGFETCKRLKANPNMAHVPVVMVTALSDVEDRVKGLACGADDFLTKPIDDMALFARIRSLVRLKMMTDELLLRDKTAGEFGVDSQTTFQQDVVQGSRIAIIDDDLAQSQRISDFISQKGAFIDIISDMGIVSNKVIQGNYDLIIISTQLADIDALRLSTNFKSNLETRNVPILILVDEQDTSIIIKALDLGVNDYIIQPIDENELIARINTQLRRKKYQDALKTNYQKSVSMATTDSLTGMYNRHYFDSHFKTLFAQAIRDKRNLSIMILDIDFFKKVNDEYGHLAGDAILRQVPARIVQAVRPTDLVARYGGEEFVVILPNTDLREAYTVASRVRESIDQKEFTIPIDDKEKNINKTVSVGVTTLETGDTPEMLLGRSDKALYQAKENGRNKVVWIA